MLQHFLPRAQTQLKSALDDSLCRRFTISLLFCVYFFMLEEQFTINITFNGSIQLRDL